MIVVKKYRALLDGSNAYRRLKVRLDDGTERTIKVDRDTWAGIKVGDHLDPRR